MSSCSTTPRAVRRRYRPGVRVQVRTTDVLVCAVFTAAGLTEICLRAPDPDAALSLAPGAVAYLGLLWRRTRPATALVVFCAVGILGTLAQWLAHLPEQEATVPILAMLFLTWSLGAHAGLGSVLLAAPLPVLLVSVVDLVDPTVGSLSHALPFVVVVVVLVPVLAGRLVWSRRRLAESLRQRDAEAEAAHAARLRVDRADHAWIQASDLQARLDRGLAHLVTLAERALLGSVPVLEVETAARELLGTTRAAVVRLTGSDPVAAAPASRPARHPPARDWWIVLLVAAAWAIAWGYSEELMPLRGSLVSGLLALLTGFAAGAFAEWGPGVVAAAVSGAGAMVVSGDPVVAVVFTAGGWLAGRTVADQARLAGEAKALVQAADERRRAERSAVEAAARTSLAHDLHDAVGHHLTVVALQAGAALRLGTADPEAAMGALRTARSVAAQALAELRAGLDVGDDLLGPVLHARGTGAHVTVRGLVAVPEEQRHLVHRVVQEGLTNALRHASGAAVTVSVEHLGGQLHVVVSNGPGGTAISDMGSGRGLTGLRERLTQAGGTLEAGRAQDGGFRLEAALPVAVEVPA